jgi:acyl-CoA synthetase (AMP-forming)/AMP-acid ligase II
VHAVIVPRDGAAPSEGEIIEWCRSRIAGYKRPRSVSFIGDAEMPRTATGKIQHRLLRLQQENAAADPHNLMPSVTPERHWS